MLRENIDSNPYTGSRNVKGKLRVKTDEWLTKFFDGTEGVEQVRNVTMGKIYDVVKIEGIGDCEDITIINDIGEPIKLGDFFFEEVE